MQKLWIAVIAISAVLFGLRWAVSVPMKPVQPVPMKPVQQTVSASKDVEAGDQTHQETGVADNVEQPGKAHAPTVPAAAVTPGAVVKAPPSAPQEPAAAKIVSDTSWASVEATPQEMASHPAKNSLKFGQVADVTANASSDMAAHDVNRDNMAKIVQLDKYFEQ